MSVDTGTATSAVPGGMPGGGIPITTPPILPGAGTPDPSAQVGEMTKRLLATLAQASQRKQFAGQPAPSPVPGMHDPNAARQIGMNTANPHAWGTQRFMAGLGASIQNAVAKKKQQDTLKAEADWSYMQSALNELYAAQSSGDQNKVKEAQAKVDVVMGDPKKLKNMAKALNQDWLNPEKTTVYGEALKNVNKKTQQTDAQKTQAAQGLKGMVQKLLQRKQQPQTSPEENKAMGREVQAKAPTAAVGATKEQIQAELELLKEQSRDLEETKKEKSRALLEAQKAEEAEKRQAERDKAAEQRQEQRDKAAEVREESRERSAEKRTQEQIAGADRRAALAVGGGGAAKDIADAIEMGDQPPTTTGLYKQGAAVRAELARRKVPLAKMETDWKATQQYVKTLNGPQQTRLRQDISTVSDSLDKVEGLYNEWEKLAPQSGYKVLNRGTLAAMKQLPGRPGAVAQALEAQIADTTAGLGTIYMGGNSPTDHSLELASKSLSSDWNDDTFKEGLKQARANVKIRQNSIMHSLPAGVSANSPYSPKDSGDGGGDTVNVISPDGRPGTIPKANLQKALARGYKSAQ